MRCFIAIDIDENNRMALGDLQQQLKSKVDVKRSDVKWVKPGNIHLTLKFLGEIKDEQVVDICNIVKEVAGRHNSFELSIESVGHFGGRSARVLWVGTGEGREKLLELQKDLEQELASAGWPAEKRAYSGHLTLCRVRNPKAGFKLVQIIEQYNDFKVGVMSADSISVFQSELTPAGPIYTVLSENRMQGS
ncbi:MAG: RNA 2',3'-cyclic phosphodiesterase [Phycisphaerae bacterium]|nr:RNA 2',3'-cyclic phosphodiesterase [Phycisphaerae bacterium]NIW72661.1 RNA 2',3'-cyclic phosphodiesterase [candidate division KSB1 bacterium]NIP52138.1 RNA 2',3'-cyclic phosphodiesterase [Phycisphaerae bacterium]NIS51144.1 RNA 2',3'-cyclic phosphodiesterase [Phycisphaerae bacterium]NIU08814.1 RNA 2',3'-cyclic phosphodiesterase [Phycisphaerae bacterium]